MRSRRRWCRWLEGLQVMGLGVCMCACAEGADAESLVLGSGLYDLLTVGLEGSCTLDGALTPGPEHVGKVARVLVESSEHAVTIEACDPFFDDCFATIGEPMTLLRSGDALLADEPSWVVSACTCFDDFRAARSVEGRIVDDDSAELGWTFSVPSPPAGCTCDGWFACEASVSQQLVRP